MSARSEPEQHYCPYLERIIVLEYENDELQREVGANGLKARVKYMESDAFAMSVGNRIAEHVAKRVVKAGLKWAAAGIFLLMGATIPGLLKVWGVL